MDNAHSPEGFEPRLPDAGALGLPGPMEPARGRPTRLRTRRPLRAPAAPAPSAETPPALPGLTFVPTAVDGAYEITLTPFQDARGTFGRAFCAETFRARGLMDRFVHANLSGNPRKGTLRGMHIQDAPRAEAKLVRAVRGRVQDVVVDLRPASPTYLRWASIELSAQAQNSVYVPEGCAHGFLTLEDQCEVFYLVSDVYAPDLARTYRWDDPAFAIQWQIAPTLISDRDAAAQDYRP